MTLRIGAWPATGNDCKRPSAPIVSMRVPDYPTPETQGVRLHNDYFSGVTGMEKEGPQSGQIAERATP
jgi:hypothetical protein